MNVYDFQATRLDGSPASLGDWRGQALLIVNTASKCGFTPQYAGLEALHQRFGGRGFSVIGFPCNQFGGQEPGSSEEIASFCDLNFGVSFPLMAKVDVNGPNAHPLWSFLTRARRGLLGSAAVKWNFTKFLVDRQGEPVRRFAPLDKPETLTSAIEFVL